MNTSVKSYILIGLTLLMLTGCGKVEKPQDTSESSKNTEASQEPLVEVDPLLTEWVYSDEVTAADSMWSLDTYVEGFLPEADGREFGGRWDAVDGDCYRTLSEFYQRQDDGTSRKEYYMTSYQLDTMTSETVPFVLKPAEGMEEMTELVAKMEDYHANITGFDTISGTFWFWVQVADDEHNMVQYLAVRTDENGNIKEWTDLWPQLANAGFYLDQPQLLTGTVADAEGRTYVFGPEHTEVYVMDCEGTFLQKLESPNGTLAYFFYVGKLPQGTPVYEYTPDRERMKQTISFDGKQMVTLFSGEEYVESAKYINRYGEVFFQRNKNLLRWNVADGSCQKIYDQLGDIRCEKVLLNTAGEIFLVFEDTFGKCMLKLADKPKQEPVEVEILSISYSEYISECADDYSRKHPGVKIRVNRPEETADVAMTRLVAELSTGGGPQMLVLRRDELLMLQEKGALADLTGVLPEETVSQIYDGVLQNGMVDGGLYGITCEASINTLMVSKQVWEQESWTYDDVINLIREREKAGKPVDRFATGSYETSMYSTLYNLALRDIPASPFLDAQGQSGSYNSREFMELLELCKKYGKYRAGDIFFDESEQKQELEEQRALVYVVSGNLVDFSNACALLGDDYHCVGYPMQDGSESFFEFYQGSVAVNANAKEREVIDDFLRYLLDYTTQRRYCLNWVRKDVLEDCVLEKLVISEGAAPQPVFLLGGNNVIPLAGRKDGGSYLPEYLELTGRCVPSRTEWDDVCEMIYEETDPFFSGEKSAKKVTEILQSRVEIYLNE